MLAANAIPAHKFPVAGEFTANNISVRRKYGKEQDRKLVSVNSMEPWKPHEGKIKGHQNQTSLASATAKEPGNRQKSVKLHQAQCKLDSEIWTLGRQMQSSTSSHESKSKGLVCQQLLVKMNGKQMNDNTKQVYPWHNDSRGGWGGVEGHIKIHTHALLPDSRTMRRNQYGGGRREEGQRRSKAMNQRASKMQWLNDSSL